jgi:CBS domain containing-hemolysin-like protein
MWRGDATTAAYSRVFPTQTAAGDAWAGRAHHGAGQPQRLGGGNPNGFGKLPAVGDSFDMYGWRFEVVDLDDRRVDKVLATKLPPTRRILT